ncbi:MAG: twin-arginine translocase subunit TatC [Verrucomicrobia bacterium]|nr:twin-arginine translocase subunit TatC [Verrucomicrobiota bacterium]
MSEPEEFSPEAEEAAPKKSFWAHLDDLRKAVVRSAIAVGIALVACLLLDDKLVGILEYPLHRIDIFEQAKPSITLQIGDAKIGPYTVTREQFPALPPGEAPQVVFQLGTMQVGQEQVVTLKAVPAKPGDKANLRVRLHNLSPTEAFFVAFRVALYGAFVLSAPFWLYFMGQFFLPALHRGERRTFFAWFGWGVVLFFTGVLLTYFLLLPIALKASMTYSEMLGFNATDWRAEEYVSFVTKFIFGMGLGFQFPIVVLILVKLGMLTHQQLAQYRRHVIVLCLILGAVLTTPEVITQIAMAVPLYILYEVSIWIAWYWDRKKRRAAGIIEV